MFFINPVTAFRRCNGTGCASVFRTSSSTFPYPTYNAFDFGASDKYTAAWASARCPSGAPRKSNALYVAYGDVLEDVKKTEAQPVPLHLRNAVTGLMRNIGYGEGYQYAHDFDEKVTEMRCLPDNLAGRTYYKPTDQGLEMRLRVKMDEIAKIRRRVTGDS